MSGMDPQLALRIAELALGGEPPEPVGRRGIGAQLAGLGWRIVPVPKFRPEGYLKYGSTPSAAAVDFKRPREFLVIPPDGHPVPAQKIEEKLRAIRWACERATAPEPGGDA